MEIETKYPSPSGRYVFQIVAWEARMSLWIESFTLVEAATRAPVMLLQDDNWSVDSAEWLGDSVVKMRLRKYPGNHTPSQVEVSVDCEGRTAEVQGGVRMPLAQLEHTLDRTLSWRKG